MQIKIKVVYLQKQNTQHTMKARKYFTLWVAAALIAAGVILHTSTGLALLIAGMAILMINVLTL